MKKTAKKIVAGTVGAAGLFLASAATAVNADSVHHVAKNDTVWALSQKYGVSIKSIEQLNHIDPNTNMIYAGQDLQIPNKDAQAPKKDNTKTYVVQSGDSLWTIAQKFNTSVDQLKQLNGLTSNLIQPGQTLKVSGQAVAQPAKVQKQVKVVAQPVQQKAQVAKTTVVSTQKAAPAVKAPVVSSTQASTQKAAPVQQQTVQSTVKSTPAVQSSVASSTATPSSSSSSTQTAVTSQSSSAAEVTSSSTSAVQSSVASSTATPSSSSSSQQQAAPSSSATSVVSSQAQTSSANTNVQSSSTQQTQTASSSSQQQATQQNTQQQNNNNQAAKASSQAQASSTTRTGSGNNVVSYAESFIGVPYVYGGTTPSGFDCSGFVQYVYNHFGKSLPRTTTQQENCGTQIPVSQAQPGDLYFWGSKGSTYHVAICIGNGKYIAAPEPGQSVSIGSTQYFQPSFAVRL